MLTCFHLAWIPWTQRNLYPNDASVYMFARDSILLKLSKKYMYVLKINYDDKIFIAIILFYINHECTLIYWLRSSRSKATCLNEFQKQRRFSCSRGSHNDNPAIGRQIWHQMILYFSIYPLPGKITTLFIFLRMLSKYFSIIRGW